MKTIKFLAVTAMLFFSTSLVNGVNASNPVSKHQKETKIASEVSESKPLIRIIYLYTVCPNGAVRAVGNIGLTDNGTYIGTYYWGEAIACANDQVVLYA